MAKSVEEQKREWKEKAINSGQCMLHLCSFCHKEYYGFFDIQEGCFRCLNCAADRIFFTPPPKPDEPKEPFLTEDMERVYSTAPKPDPDFFPGARKLDVEDFARI